MPKEKAVFVPTREQRHRVEEMVAADMPPELISKEIAISITILKSHFRDELRDGKEYVRQRAKLKLIQMGLRDKKPTGLTLSKIISLTTETVAPQGGDRRSSPTLRLGKKETQKIEADEANKGLYATPAPPKVSLQ